MIIDAKVNFKIKRALNGDKVALCEVIDLYAEKENWVKSVEFLEIFVDFEPKTCEPKFVEIIGDELSYEDMLRVIAWTYYRDLDNDYMAFKWFQKYFDYIDYKFHHLDATKREELKNECCMYPYMKERDLLDKIENRFLLKWEHDLLYKKQP